MAWEQILGFFTMWLHPEVTVSLWSKAGVPFWWTFLYITCWTSITLIVTYFGIGVIKSLAKLILKGVVKLIRVFKKDFAGFRKNRFQDANKKYQKRLICWLNRQENWVVLACSSVPFVWGLPAAVIITVKTIGIKHGLLILLAGNVIRNGIICYIIYQGLIKIFS